MENAPVTDPDKTASELSTSEALERLREPSGPSEDDRDKTASEDDRARHPNGSTFGKPGELVQEVVSGMEKVAAVSGEERQKPRTVVKRSEDLDTPKPKKSARVLESPTSTAAVHVSPAYGSAGHREHQD